MLVLSVAPLTKAGFAPFGEVVETADVKPKLINEGFAERFDDLAGIDVAAEGGEVNVSLFMGAARPVPLVIKLMERHPLGSQLFMPLSGAPWLVVVCGDPDVPQATGHLPHRDDRRELRAKLLAPSAARRRGRQSVRRDRPRRGRAATSRRGGLKRQTGCTSRPMVRRKRIRTSRRSRTSGPAIVQHNHLQEVVRRNVISNLSRAAGRHPAQTELLTGRAVFTDAYAVIPKGVIRDIVTSYLPHWDNTRVWVLARPLSGFAETFSHYLMDVAPGGGSESPEPDAGAEGRAVRCRGGELPCGLPEPNTCCSPAALPTCLPAAPGACKTAAPIQCIFTGSGSCTSVCLISRCPMPSSPTKTPLRRRRCLTRMAGGRRRVSSIHPISDTTCTSRS